MTILESKQIISKSNYDINTHTTRQNNYHCNQENSNNAALVANNNTHVN